MAVDREPSGCWPGVGGLASGGFKQRDESSPTRAVGSARCGKNSGVCQRLRIVFLGRAAGGEESGSGRWRSETGLSGYGPRDCTGAASDGRLREYIGRNTPRRGLPGDTANRELPGQWSVLRGVFTEPDGKNRIRRALLGGGAAAPQFVLYVGVFNLARADQPLYQVAPVQSVDSHYGPVIALNAYLPLVKFNVDKSPSEEDVRKVCAQIVGQLTTLLGQNGAVLKP